MTLKTLKFLWLGIATLCCSLTQASLSEGSWPPTPPTLGVFQTRSVFSLSALRHFEGLLVRHEHLTGERLLLVVQPWDGRVPNEPAQKLSALLATQWKLDTTRGGLGTLLVLQEFGGGRFQVGYHPGIGLSKSQVAEDSDLEALVSEITEKAQTGSWDHIAEASAIWLFQTQNSPLLEDPGLLSFPKPLPPPTSTQSAPTSAGTSPTQPAEPRGSSVLSLLFLSVATLFLLTAVRSGMRQRVLHGSHRQIRFGITDGLSLRLRSDKGHGSSRKRSKLLIESLEGSP